MNVIEEHLFDYSKNPNEKSYNKIVELKELYKDVPCYCCIPDSSGDYRPCCHDTGRCEFIGNSEICFHCGSFKEIENNNEIKPREPFYMPEQSGSILYNPSNDKPIYNIYLEKKFDFAKYFDKLKKKYQKTLIHIIDSYKKETEKNYNKL